MMDSISAFHWLDKVEEEVGRTRWKRICNELECLLAGRQPLSLLQIVIGVMKSST